MRPLIFILLTLFVSLSSGLAQTPDLASKATSNANSIGNLKESTIERHWKVGGVDRVALVYAPESARTTASPLIFAFHGHGGTAQNVARRMDFQHLWPEAIVVYMQGLATPGALTDPDGKLPGWQMAPGFQGDRDLKFFDAVLDSVKKEYKVDTKRIFATGHSNGGGFTYLLWAERGDVFAAFAPSAATAARNLAHLKPKPAMHIAGENDQLVRFVWQEKAMESVRALNKCEATGKEWARAGNIKATLYPSKTGTPFISAIFPGPHAFPVEAAGLVVKFFKSYPDLQKSAEPTKEKGNL